MKLLTPAFALLTALAVAGVLWLCSYAGAGESLQRVFLDSPIPTQLMDVLLAFAAAALLAVGLIPGGASAGAPVMRTAIWVAPVLGLLAATPADWQAWRLAAATHFHNLRALAPSLAGGLAPLALGLLCATICAAFAYGVGRAAAAR